MDEYLNPYNQIKAVLVSEGPEDSYDNYLDYFSGVHILAPGQDLAGFRPWYRWFSIRPETEVLRGKFIGGYPGQSSGKLEWISESKLVYTYCDQKIDSFRNKVKTYVENSYVTVEVVLKKDCVK